MISLLILLPFLGSLLIFFTEEPSENIKTVTIKKKIYNKTIRQIALITSLITFFISLI